MRAEEATIKLYRRWNWAGAIRKFTLVVDGQKIGTISNGKTESFNVAAGSRSIYVKGALWAKTEQIDIILENGATRSFECGVPSRYWLSFGLLFVASCAQYYFLHFHGFVSGLLGIVIILLGIIITIGSFKPGFLYYLKEVQSSNLP